MKHDNAEATRWVRQIDDGSKWGEKNAKKKKQETEGSIPEFIRANLQEQLYELYIR